MKEAAKVEAELVIAKGEVDADGTPLSAGHIMLVASRELKKPLLPAVDQLSVTTKFSAGVTSRRVFVSG